MCQIDLNTHAMCLLNFVEDSVAEALEDNPSREALLVEADGALGALQRLLKRSRAEWLTLFMLLDLDNVSFQCISARRPADLVEAMRSGLEGIAALRKIIEQVRLSGADSLGTPSPAAV